jgi:hypothetical protein
MDESRIPDPTLMARLQLSVKGVDWAASRVKAWQHEPFEGGWSAHQHLAHLLATEVHSFHVRIRRALDEDVPTLRALGQPGGHGGRTPKKASISKRSPSAS